MVSSLIFSRSAIISGERRASFGFHSVEAGETRDDR